MRENRGKTRWGNVFRVSRISRLMFRSVIFPSDFDENLVISFREHLFFFLNFR